MYQGHKMNIFLYSLPFLSFFKIRSLCSYLHIAKIILVHFQIVDFPNCGRFDFFILLPIYIVMYFQTLQQPQFLLLFCVLTLYYCFSNYQKFRKSNNFLYCNIQKNSYYSESNQKKKQRRLSDNFTMSNFIQRTNIIFAN